mgnify:FL=1
MCCGHFALLTWFRYIVWKLFSVVCFVPPLHQWPWTRRLFRKNYKDSSRNGYRYVSMYCMLLVLMSASVCCLFGSFLTNEELPTLKKFQCDYELAIGTGDCAYGTWAIRKLTTMVILPMTPNSYPRNCTMTTLTYQHTVSSKIHERCYTSMHIL